MATGSSRTAAASASTIEFSSRGSSTSVTGRPLASEVPKSPRSTSASQPR
ncbi:hypothetical protein [Rhodobacter sp. SGA-6-6]|nr:hypothetical protein [Rhodobacter sp. SGA-6-6]